MSQPTGYGVIRRAADLPESFQIGDLDGKWIEISDPRSFDRHSRPARADAIAVPTGRFEANEAGAVAEVYEVRP